MEFYSTTMKTGILSLAGKWVKSCMFSLICGT
jgi:hypothetical protein